MSEAKLGMTRRDALRLLVVGGAGVAVVGCGGGASLDCSSTAGLAADAVAMRTTQSYTDRSTRADMCSACTFFTAGAAGACGTCTVVGGPINPEGYCNLFSRRPT